MFVAQAKNREPIVRRVQVVTSLLMFVTFVHAQAPTTAPAISGKLGTPMQVFNGKDLSGLTWFADPAAANASNPWSVKDGVLHCTGKSNGYIRSEKEFTGDFIITIEYRHITRGGAGFLFGISGPDKIWPKSMQVRGPTGGVGELVNQGDFNWFVDPDRFRNDRMRMFGPSSEKPMGQWNTVEIFVDHSNCWVLINGQFQNIATGMDDLAGKIGLQSEGSEIECRKMTVTPIEKNELKNRVR